MDETSSNSPSKEEYEQALARVKAHMEQPEFKVKAQAEQIYRLEREKAELKRSLHTATWIAIGLFFLMMWSFSGERRHITEFWERLDSAMEKLDNNNTAGWAELDKLREDAEPPEPDEDEPY